MRETYFELEKVRFYRFKGDRVSVKAKSQNVQSLFVKYKAVKIRDGKTFGEKVRIVERNSETDEVIDYPFIRYVGEEVR